jgi:hypothetical protein
MVQALMLLRTVERKPVLSNCITLWKAEASAVGEKLALTAMRREKTRNARNGEGSGGGREQHLREGDRRSQESEAMAIELLARRKS